MVSLLIYFACGRKAKPKNRETKTNAKCRVGRTIQEMREWLKENPGVVPCEVDTVIGSISGKVLFTIFGTTCLDPFRIPQQSLAQVPVRTPSETQETFRGRAGSVAGVAQTVRPRTARPAAGASGANAAAADKGPVCQPLSENPG